MTPFSESLKQELLQAQKTRDEFMKWKVLLVTSIGSVALGFSANPTLPFAELALCTIPFACVYVDLLCRNLSIRTKLISRFMAGQMTSESSNLSVRFESYYADFDRRLREAYNYSSLTESISLEGLALTYSTRAISVGIVVLGTIISITKEFGDLYNAVDSIFFVLAGGAGFLISILVERIYERQKDEILRLSVDSSK